MLAWLIRQKGSIWEGEQFDDLFLGAPFYVLCSGWMFILNTGLLEELEHTDGGVVAVTLAVVNQVLKSSKFLSKFRDYAHVELLILSLLEALRDDTHSLQPALRLVEGVNIVYETKN